MFIGGLWYVLYCAVIIDVGDLDFVRGGLEACDFEFYHRPKRVAWGGDAFDSH